MVETRSSGDSDSNILTKTGSAGEPDDSGVSDDSLLTECAGGSGLDLLVVIGGVSDDLDDSVSGA